MAKNLQVELPCMQQQNTRAVTSTPSYANEAKDQVEGNLHEDACTACTCKAALGRLTRLICLTLGTCHA